MQRKAAFHPGLHCLLRLKQPPGTEKHHILEIFIFDPIKGTLGSPILIVSICMGTSIGIQRVNHRYTQNILYPQNIRVLLSKLLISFTFEP